MSAHRIDLPQAELIFATIQHRDELTATMLHVSQQIADDQLHDAAVQAAQSIITAPPKE